MSAGIGMLDLGDGCVALSTVAREVTTQYGPAAVLNFLATVDRYMGSPEFTRSAANLFHGKALRVPNEGEADPRGQALANLSEFVRQMGLNPKVRVDPEFYGTWTDPAAQPVSLRLDDLETLLELAALGLEKVGK